MTEDLKLRKTREAAAEQGQRQPRVAGRGFDDLLAGLEPPFRPGLREHEGDDAVLYRAAGVLTLQLGEDAHAGLGLAVLELDQGSMADKREQVHSFEFSKDDRARPAPSASHR